MAKLKGNAVIGQSGGPTCVINQSLVGVITECRKHPEVKKLYGAVEGVKGILNENFLDLFREKPETVFCCPALLPRHSPDMLSHSENSARRTICRPFPHTHADRPGSPENTCHT